MGCKTGTKERNTRVYTCSRCGKNNEQKSCGRAKEICNLCLNKKNPCLCGCGKFVRAAQNNSQFISGHNTNLNTIKEQRRRRSLQHDKFIEKYPGFTSKEIREKISKTIKQQHRDGKYVNAYGNISSKVERSLKPFLEPLGFTHTEDFKFHVRAKGGKTRIPDYVNRSTREIVEVWGTYWHRGENPQDLIDWYRDCGWKARVVWENEVDEFAVNMGGG